MEKLNNPSEISLIFRYALKDLSRNYKKISSIIATLFISLFILSAIFTIEDSLKKELNDNAKALLGGDLEIDYNRNEGNLKLVNEVKKIATISQMIEFSTMVSTTNKDKNKSLFIKRDLFLSLFVVETIVLNSIICEIVAIFFTSFTSLRFPSLRL